MEEFNKIKAGTKLVVVDFYATWCGPCKMIAPKILEFVDKYPDVEFVKVDVDEQEAISEGEQISAMPTFIFYKGGKKVDELKGANAAKLEELIQKHK